MRVEFITIASVILISLAQVEPAAAIPLVVRCSAEGNRYNTYAKKNLTRKIQINIALPEKNDRLVAVADRAGESFDFPDIQTPVGVGAIEINEENGPPHRYKFVVTRMPSESDSLVGFYLEYSYIVSIRANLWKKEKTFTYFDTMNDEMLRGKCD